MQPFHPHPDRARIEHMIEQRRQPGADVDALDAQIWQQFGQVKAVLYTDLVGFSRQVETFGIIHFLQIIHESRRLLGPIISAWRGMVLKEEGDSLLMVFESAQAAVQCALQMQAAVKTWSEGRSPEERIDLCVGLGWGRVLMIGEVDVFGSEVNAACKLGEDRARGGEVLATHAFVEAVEGRGDWVCERCAHEPGSFWQAWRIQPLA